MWFASMSPLTRWFVATYGERRVSATWIDAGPQGMKFASWRSRMRSSDWCTCTTPSAAASHPGKNKGGGGGTHVRRVDVALDDVEDGDVARGLARRRRDHPVLGLQQPAHHVEHGRAPDRLSLGRGVRAFSTLSMLQGG